MVRSRALQRFSREFVLWKIVLVGKSQSQRKGNRLLRKWKLFADWFAGQQLQWVFFRKGFKVLFFVISETRTNLSTSCARKTGVTCTCLSCNIWGGTDVQNGTETCMSVPSNKNTFPNAETRGTPCRPRLHAWGHVCIQLANDVAARLSRLLLQWRVSVSTQSYFFSIMPTLINLYKQLRETATQFDHKVQTCLQV